MTPLMRVALWNNPKKKDDVAEMHEDMVELLLEAGADPLLTDAAGQTAVGIARERARLAPGGKAQLAHLMEGGKRKARVKKKKKGKRGGSGGGSFVDFAANKRFDL